jgi:small subunit ribosomal protein S9
MESKKKTTKDDTEPKIKQQRKEKYFYGVGGRKESKARVRLYKGKGEIIINDRKVEEYFNKPLIQIIEEPLVLTNNKGKFDISVKVLGGGKVGQAESIRHGASRALVISNPDLKVTLKKAGFLTRDPRAKERKKYGLKRARKAPQYRKR